MRTTIKSFTKIVSSLALTTLVFASCASAGIIFQDDFNDGNRNGWTDSAGTPWWAMPNTSVVGNEFAWNGLGQSSADALNGLSDLDLAVDVTNPGMSEAILFRYKDGNNYGMAFHNGWFNYIQIFQVFDGGYTCDNRVDTPDIAGAFKMHAQVTGNQVTFTIYNDTNSYTTGEALQSQLLGPGKYGLWGDSGSAPESGKNVDGILQYDNFVASTVPEPSSLFALASGLVGILGIVRRRH